MNEMNWKHWIAISFDVLLAFILAVILVYGN